MKTNFYLFLITILLFTSCSSLQQGAVNDDLYYSPKDEPARTNVVAVNSSSNIDKSEFSDKRFDKEISAILEDETIEDIDTTIYQSEDGYENPYDKVVVDSYEEARERRIAAMSDPTYGITNNYFLRFSDDYWYAQSFIGDPFYNVVMVGNSVWVEPYWMGGYNSYWYYNPYSYYSYSYYNPYYYGYYPSYWGYSHYPYYSWGGYTEYWFDKNNQNYAGSSFNSFRQRSLAGTTGVRSSSVRSSRNIRDEYMGRDISASSTLKSGTESRSVRDASSARLSGTNRVRENNIAGETIRLKETRTATSSNNIRTTNRQTTSGATSNASRNYTRPNQATRSTYSSPASSRYNRPASSNVRSGQSSSGVSRSSSTPVRSGSTYSPSRSSSSSSSNRSSGTTTRSSSSSSRSSGSYSRSSGSSGSSRSSSNSSSSSSGRGGRR